MATVEHRGEESLDAGDGRFTIRRAGFPVGFRAL
jgi:hypothetical protein